ncbi:MULTISPECIES: SH3 domain-containing protein [Spirulina sp. CCY15215]|uniref:SH3 domain-containing protein n=1 Tax=Spirulina sp. CCY15215 TaxID=2767591 RepID=UPI00194E9E0D|nr:SH3 domain-containing protein [Spirulina major]
MKLSSIGQFILGIVLGISILGISGAAAGYYFFSKMAVVPSKPVYPEERPQSSEDSAKEGEGEGTGEEEVVSEPEAPKVPLPEGAYRVRVNWPDGLSLRDKPDFDADRLEVIPYDAEMIVLRSNEDGTWDWIRIPGTNKEGWVKAGNSDRIEED